MSELEDKINSILNNPEEMNKIVQMAASIMNGGNQKDTSGAGSPDPGNALASLGGIDPAMLSSIGRLISRAENSFNKHDLLEAMKPYLSEKRREKIDKAIQVAKMAKVAQIALAEYGGKKDGL
ncbi:MAG: hypothetical protein ACOX7I_00125 [Oscillospiraceae bacterium]